MEKELKKRSLLDKATRIDLTPKPDTTREGNCELYCDHTPVWAGDGFYCSKCDLKFRPVTPSSDKDRLERKYKHFMSIHFGSSMECSDFEGTVDDSWNWILSHAKELGELV